MRKFLDWLLSMCPMPANSRPVTESWHQRGRRYTPAAQGRMDAGAGREVAFTRPRALAASNGRTDTDVPLVFAQSLDGACDSSRRLLARCKQRGPSITRRSIAQADALPTRPMQQHHCTHLVPNHSKQVPVLRVRRRGHVVVLSKRARHCWCKGNDAGANVAVAVAAANVHLVSSARPAFAFHSALAHHQR